ncbi:MAG: hypothetical protein WKF57_00280 [Nakamurella sp.]
MTAMSRGNTVSLARQNRLPCVSVPTSAVSRYRSPMVEPGASSGAGG